MVIILIGKKNVIPPEVPLWYLQPWGETQLAPGNYLWGLPGIAMLVLIANLFLAKLFYRRERFISQLLIFTSTIVSFLLGFAFYRIMRLVV
ncbi:MAG: hypothetical protein FJ044_04380 [Candidatus Cloacimonetes bacterium]|nr:hypothetical protein [Candidatus Cloacimonadota bacterium]